MYRKDVGMAKKHESWTTHKWTASEVKRISLADLMRMELGDVADLAQYYYEKFRRNLNQAKRAGVMPYGIEKVLNDYQDSKRINVTVGGEKKSLADVLGYEVNSPIVKHSKGSSTLLPKYQDLKNPRNTLIVYINAMREYSGWKTATVAGWNKFAFEQDVRLFGTDEGGNPNFRMTDEQRKKFFALYEELKQRGNMHWDSSEPLVDSSFTRVWREGLAKEEWDLDDITGMAKTMEDLLSPTKVRFPEYPRGKEGDPTQQGDVFVDAYDDPDFWGE